MLLFIPISPSVFKARSIEDGRSEDSINTALAACMLFCFLITSVAYYKVFRIIRQHQQQVQGNQSSQNFGQPTINLAKYKKSVVSILYILAVFSFCFLPMTVALGMMSVKESDFQEMEAVFSVTLVLVFLSSSLNPVLYLWRLNDIRIGVKHLLCWNT